MGEDKALRSFLGHPLIEHVRDRVAEVGDELIVITNRPDAYQFLDLPLYSDLIPNRGPLGGLYTALSVATHPLVGVVACDLPFASPTLLNHLKTVLMETNVDAALPSTESGLEPLHAVYRRVTCLPHVKKALEDDVWRMIGWHDKADVKILSPAETRQHIEHPQVFWNINTPEEFDKAEQEAQKP